MAAAARIAKQVSELANRLENDETALTTVGEGFKSDSSMAALPPSMLQILKFAKDFTKDFTESAPQ